MAGGHFTGCWLLGLGWLPARSPQEQDLMCVPSHVRMGFC
jgi:hypothetical protein